MLWSTGASRISSLTAISLRHYIPSGAPLQLPVPSNPAVGITSKGKFCVFLSPCDLLSYMLDPPPQPKKANHELPRHHPVCASSLR